MKQRKKDKSKKLVQVFLLAVDNLQYTSAITVFEKYRLHKKLSPNLLCKLGLLYDHRAQKRRKPAKKSDESEAMNCYLEALQKHHNYYKGYNGIGRIHWHKKNISEAIRFYKKALRYTPKNEKWKGYQNLGNVYKQNKKYSLAEKNYKKSLKLKYIFGLLYNLSTLYYFWNKKERAQKYAYTALQKLEKEYLHKKKTNSYRLFRNTLVDITQNKL